MTLGQQDPQTEQDVMARETERSSWPSPSVAAPAFIAEGSAALPVSARNSSPAADDADHADDVTGQAPRADGGYIYGYDSAGNPTLTEASSFCPSDDKLP